MTPATPWFAVLLTLDVGQSGIFLPQYMTSSTAPCHTGCEDHMAQYALRDIPLDIWSSFRTRANRDKWPVRALLLQLMSDYGNERLTPTAPPPSQMDEYRWVRPYYSHLAKQSWFAKLNSTEQWTDLRHYVAKSSNRSRSEVLDAMPETARLELMAWLRDTTTVGFRDEKRLTLRAIAHIGDGMDLTQNRRAIQYEVLGLPPGQQAWIAHFPGQMWMLMRAIAGKQDDAWHGHYRTPQAALQALEGMTNSEDSSEKSP